MSLPIVMIFNRHWESSPFSVISNLLPELAKEGYDTFCQELPDSNSEEEAFQWSEQTIKRRSEFTHLFNLHADKKKLSYPEDLQRCAIEEFREALPSIPSGLQIELKSLSASKIWHENLLLAKNLAFSIVCIDDTKVMNALNSTPMSSPQYMQTLAKTSRTREAAMVNRLVHLQTEGKGIIIPLGWKHFKPMIELLKGKGLSEEDIVCHFPHSSYQASLAIDEIKHLIETGQVASGKTSCVTTREEIALLGQKILAEVKSKMIKNNCHIQFLSDYFKVNFKPLLRPEYHLDAFLPINQMKDSIKLDLEDLGIEYRLDRNVLVIPDVNTTEVAHRIRLLPYKV